MWLDNVTNKRLFVMSSKNAKDTMKITYEKVLNRIRKKQLLYGKTLVAERIRLSGIYILRYKSLQKPITECVVEGDIRREKPMMKST